MTFEILDVNNTAITRTVNVHKVPLSEIDSFEEIPSGKICDQDYVRGISHSQSNTYITNGTTLYRHTYYTVAVFIKMRIT